MKPKTEKKNVIVKGERKHSCFTANTCSKNMFLTHVDIFAIGCGILKHPSLIFKQSKVTSQLSGQSQKDLIGQSPVQCNSD